MMKSDEDVSLRPIGDGGLAPPPDGPWVTAWEFDDRVANTGGEWRRLIWETIAREIPHYDTWERGGTQYLLIDTGSSSACIDEIEFGILEEC